ncbi:UNVERIFIED_CONTAM: hypothetical protein Sradi_0826400 [Sesamum radiatum]|uniref:Uncharacterized protein n=1 Tax=Sesamum radiatum TaxID=300843 RepID=A0AAW2VQX5_SESRA
MADIAMLVAEEYERRVKSSRNAAEVDLSSLGSNCVGFLGGQMINLRRFKSSVWIKEKVMTVVMALEPKSQMSVAATDGFFSA